MALFSELISMIPTLRGLIAGAVRAEVAEGAGDVDAVTADAVARLCASLSNDDVAAALDESSEVIAGFERLRLLLVGIADARSQRDAGHDGLAQKKGFRNTTEWVTTLIGTSRAEAAKKVRVANSIADALGVGTGVGSGSGTDADGEAPRDGSGDGPDAGAGDKGSPDEEACVREAWDASLARAVWAGRLSSHQKDSITRGLSNPPVVPRDTAGDPTVNDAGVVIVDRAGRPLEVAADGSRIDDRVRLTRAVADTIDREFYDAWVIAADDLIGEASAAHEGDLFRAAKTLRDVLDPGACQVFCVRGLGFGG